MNIFALNQPFMFSEFRHKAGWRGKARKWSFGPRTQENLQLNIVYRGEQTITVDGVNYQQGPSQATMLCPGHREFFQYSSAEEVHHTWCAAIQPDLDRVVLKRLESMPFIIPVSELMDTLMKIGLLHRNGPRRLREKLAEAIFHEFFYRSGLFDDEPRPLPDQIQRVCHYIEGHYCESCTTKDFAQVACLSAQHLSRLFRKHLSCTPNQLLWQTRVEKGLAKLRDTDLTVEEIAYQSGFKSPYHFSRLVKKYYGLSPRDVRQREWASDTKTERSVISTQISQNLKIHWANEDFLRNGFPIEGLERFEEGQQFFERAVRSRNCWLASIQGNAVACMILDHTFFSYGFISLIYVKPENRRQGVAAALLEHGERICRTSKIYISSGESNQPMKELLRKLDYEKCGAISNLDPQGEEMVYSKNLVM